MSLNSTNCIMLLIFLVQIFQYNSNCNIFFSKGKGKQYGHPSLIVSPDTLILSHSGIVKVSTHVARGKGI